jgi:hypothetical protein
MWGCSQTELGGQWSRHYDNRCKGREALMWKITTRGFTLQEVLIMAATNIASTLIATDTSERTTTPRTEIQQATGDCYGKGD